MWLLRVLLGFYIGEIMGMGVIGIWIGMYCDWIVRTLIYTRRYIKGTWLKKIKVRTQEK
jgi:Na+-driven multidrug efflux pump